jgi:hypothetical protein
VWEADRNDAGGARGGGELDGGGGELDGGDRATPLPPLRMSAVGRTQARAAP